MWDHLQKFFGYPCGSIYSNVKAIHVGLSYIVHIILAILKWFLWGRNAGVWHSVVCLKNSPERLNSIFIREGQPGCAQQYQQDTGICEYVVVKWMWGESYACDIWQIRSITSVLQVKSTDFLAVVYTSGFQSFQAQGQFGSGNPKRSPTLYIDKKNKNKPNPPRAMAFYFTLKQFI